MFTHIVVGANDIAASKAFYDAALTPLGIARVMDTPERLFYFGNGLGFGVFKPIDGKAATHANGGTISFVAPSREAVDAFHAAGLANRGTCEGAPGERPNAPGNAYGAYLRDPVGNKICAFAGMKFG